jgi:hypothetical protein
VFLFNSSNFIMKNNKWKRRKAKNQSAETIWTNWKFSIAWSFEQSEKYSCPIQ